MTTALIAAVAGVIGVALGRFWDSRAESAQWRRDQQASSYVRLAEAYWDVFRALSGIADTKDTEALGDPRNWARLSDSAGAALDRWNGAFLAVLVYGSPAVAQAAAVVDGLIDSFGAKAGASSYDWEAWARETETLKSSFQQLLTAIRSDLHLPVHSARF